jgi:hypothetical protein
VLAERIEGAREEVLVHMAFRREHPLAPDYLHESHERLRGEVKRRAADVGVFSTDTAVLRLVDAPMLEQFDEWAVARRRMSLESPALVSAVPIRRLPGVVAWS